RSGNQDLMLGLALATGSNTLRGICQNVSISLAMALAARFSAFSTPTKIRRSGAGMLSGDLWSIPPMAGLTLAPHQLSFRSHTIWSSFDDVSVYGPVKTGHPLARSKLVKVLGS